MCIFCALALRHLFNSVLYKRHMWLQPEHNAIFTVFIFTILLQRKKRRGQVEAQRY